MRESFSSDAHELRPKDGLAPRRAQSSTAEPRWWIVAAFLCGLTILVGLGVWDNLLCPNAAISNGDALICHLPDVPYFLQIVLIWLLFCLFWFLSFIFGFQINEASRSRRGSFRQRVQRLTEFRPLQGTLLLQGAIAWIFLNILWWRNISPPIPFALLSISVFIAHRSLFAASTPKKRRLYLAGYGLMALLLLLIEGLLKRNFQDHLSSEWLLLCIEIGLVLVGCAALLWRSDPSAARTGEDRSPFMALGTLWPFKHILPPEFTEEAEHSQAQDHQKREADG
jgi:hypothetical protein